MERVYKYNFHSINLERCFRVCIVCWHSLIVCWTALYRVRMHARAITTYCATNYRCKPTAFNMLLCFYISNHYQYTTETSRVIFSFKYMLWRRHCRCVCEPSQGRQCHCTNLYKLTHTYLQTDYLYIRACSLL